MAWRQALVATVVIAAIGGGVAWTQIRTDDNSPAAKPPIKPTGPVAESVALVPGRLDIVALNRARQDPQAARLRSVINQRSEISSLLPQFEASKIPVLGPPDPTILNTARFYASQDHHTLVVRRPGQIVEIYGSRVALASEAARAAAAAGTDSASSNRRSAIRAPGPMAAALTAATERGLSQVHAERTEYGVDVAFVRFGAAYSLTFICDAPGAAECSEAAAVGFAASLIVLGGGQP